MFAGKYRVERELGRGAFAVVYLGSDDSLGRQVAIKVLKEGRGDDRFIREAKLLSELDDPHTVTLIDFGRDPTGQLFMVFEYVSGDTLEDRLAKTGPMPAGRVVNIISQVLMSLADAHAKGIVHRDVKPANIMLTHQRGEADFVKMLDFGVAKPLENLREVSQELTVAGQLIGTMRYMAPEQLRNERSAVPASDVYAVGLVAYEMLTGEKAAAGDDGRTVVLEHLKPEPFRIPMTIEIPPSFRNAFEMMMVKDQRRRPRNASEALRLLDSLNDNEKTVTRERKERGSRPAARRDSQPPMRATASRRTTDMQGAAAVGSNLEIDESALRQNREKPMFAPPPGARIDPAKQKNENSTEQVMWFVGIMLLSVAIVFGLMMLVM